MREKVGKSRFTVFFQWFVAPGGRKVGSLKRRVRSHLARGEMKSCTPLWREAHLEVKMYKTHHSRTTFGSWDVEKVHAVVARSTFWSQNVQNTPGSDHFWKLRCQKSARRCGAKHISKSKCTKHTRSRTTFGSWDVEKVHAVVARSTFPSQNVQNTTCSRHFWRFRCRKSARRSLRSTFQVTMYKTLHFTTTFGRSDVEKVHAVVARSTFPSQNVQNTTRAKDSGPCQKWASHFQPQALRSTTLNYTTLTLHSTTLHYITLHYTTFHYTSLHYTTLHYNYNYKLHNYTPLHYTTLHYTPLHLHYTTYTTLHYTTLHYTTLHYLPLHFTTLHYTTLHYTTTTTTLHYNHTPLH